MLCFPWCNPYHLSHGMAASVDEPETAPRWWNVSYWAGSSESRDASVSHLAQPGPSTIPLASTHEEPLPIIAESLSSGLDRILNLYREKTMEVDVSFRVMRMTFLGGFLMGGSSGYLQARQTYEINNVGRKYLSPSDALKRRMDYAILRFARAGFGMGIKCALLSGSIVILTTHVAAYRERFSSWYFPALSGALAIGLHSVGGVFAFPLGPTGIAKACGLGITSGLTLSAVAHLYALSVDKPMNDAYWLFKKDYEKDISEEAEFEKRVSELMKNEGIRWRPTAVKQLKRADEEKLVGNDA
ncbi:unnamed protein product [Auanema sp. JU1783]|nr:unnamed protein product [Auanema sp. JU1783]